MGIFNPSHGMLSNIRPILQFLNQKKGTKGRQKAMPELVTVDQIRDDDTPRFLLPCLAKESVLPPAGKILADKYTHLPPRRRER